MIGELVGETAEEVLLSQEREVNNSRMSARSLPSVDVDVISPAPTARNKPLTPKKSNLSAAKVLTVRVKSPTRENSAASVENPAEAEEPVRSLHVSPSSALMKRTAVPSKQDSFDLSRNETVNDDFCIDAAFTEVSLDRLRAHDSSLSIIKQNVTDEIDLDLLLLDKSQDNAKKEGSPISMHSGTCFDNDNSGEADIEGMSKESIERSLSEERFDRNILPHQMRGSADFSMDEASVAEKSFDKDSFDRNSNDHEDDIFHVSPRASDDASKSITPDSAKKVDTVQRILEELNLSPKSKSPRSSREQVSLPQVHRDDSGMKEESGGREGHQSSARTGGTVANERYLPFHERIPMEGSEQLSNGLGTEEVISKGSSSRISLLPPVQAQSRRKSTDVLLENFLGLEASHPVSFSMFKGMLDAEKGNISGRAAPSSTADASLSSAIEENKKMKNLLTAAVKMQEVANTITDEDFALDDATLLRLQLSKSGKGTNLKRVSAVLLFPVSIIL